MEPGTYITIETSHDRIIAGLTITETISEWNDTDDISVDYFVHDVSSEDDDNGTHLWCEPEIMTSFDEVLSDEELEELLKERNIIAEASKSHSRTQCR